MRKRQRNFPRVRLAIRAAQIHELTTGAPVIEKALRLLRAKAGRNTANNRARRLLLGCLRAWPDELKRTATWWAVLAVFRATDPNRPEYRGSTAQARAYRESRRQTERVL